MMTDFNRLLISIDRMVCDRIVQKYGLSEKEAVADFFRSETYQMVIDKETELYKCSPLIIFELWESEKITGTPRNSQYIRMQ